MGIDSAWSLLSNNLAAFKLLDPMQLYNQWIGNTANYTSNKLLNIACSCTEVTRSNLAINYPKMLSSHSHAWCSTAMFILKLISLNFSFSSGVHLHTMRVDRYYHYHSRQIFLMEELNKHDARRTSVCYMPLWKGCFWMLCSRQTQSYVSVIFVTTLIWFICTL